MLGVNQRPGWGVLVCGTFLQKSCPQGVKPFPQTLNEMSRQKLGRNELPIGHILSGIIIIR